MNSPDFYDAIYTKNPSKWNLPFRDKFMYESISRHVENPESVIDVGCGNGHSLAYLSSYWPDTKYRGLDISSVAIKHAQKIHNGIIFKQGYLGSNKFPRCSVALCMGVLEHMTNPVAAFCELKKHGKLLYVEMPDCLKSGQVEGWRESPGGQYEWHLKRETWEKHITNAGLEILEALDGPTKYTRFVWILE